MNHLDLFSGIGGFALAAKWAGFNTVGFSEIDPYASAVLKKNFPNTKNYGDIRQITRETLGQGIDLITGGFPCQPFSVAGKRKGKADDRHLWPEMLRVIKDFRPSWVIGENVAGFVNMELDSTLTDLEAEGYTTRAFIIPACAIGAPHRRDRVWIVAHSRHNNKRGQGKGFSYEQLNSKTPFEWAIEGDRLADGYQDAADTKSAGLPSGSLGQEQVQLWGSNPRTPWSKTDWPAAATRLCRVGDGLPNRVDRIKCLGNSIVPQVAYQILKGIKALST